MKVLTFFKLWWKEFDKEIDKVSRQVNIFPILGLALAAIGTATQVASGVIQNDAARDAERARRGSEELTAQRQRLQAVREARIRRAEVASAAEARGAASTSAAAGAQASIGTQLQSNLGFIESQTQANRTIGDAQLRSNRAGLIASVGSELSNFGSSFERFRARQQEARQIRNNNSAVRVNPE